MTGLRSLPIVVGAAALIARVALLAWLPHRPTVSDALLYDQAARKLAGALPGDPLEMFYGALIVVLGLLGALAIRGHTAVLAAPAIYAIIVFATLTSGDVRYALPAMPLTAIPAAALLARIRSVSGPPRRSRLCEAGASKRVR